MRAESFYLTLAQVLPTLLIAVLLELRAGLVANVRETRRDDGQFEPESIDTLSSNLAYRQRRFRNKQFLKLTRTYILIGLFFFIGEAASLAAPLVGISGWWAWLLGPLALLSVAALSLYALLLPLSAVGDAAAISHFENLQSDVPGHAPER